MFIFLLYLISTIIFMPFMVLLHEFGHAIIALLFTKGPVYINLGNGNLNKSMTIGRIKIIFRTKTYIKV